MYALSEASEDAAERGLEWAVVALGEEITGHTGVAVAAQTDVAARNIVCAALNRLGVSGSLRKFFGPLRQ